jgi:hypothetical protein
MRIDELLRPVFSFESRAIVSALYATRRAKSSAPIRS